MDPGFQFGNNSQNQNFKKNEKKKKKKTPEDIITLHKCTKNYDHMMYGSWDMVYNRWTDGETDRTDGQKK